MDTSEYLDTSEAPALSYDDTVPYEDQITTTSHAPESSEAGKSLADRIGSTKVYLLSDASKSRGGKRKHEDEEDEEDVEMDQQEPSLIRDNAILLHGSPISHLPTSNIFAYATSFDAHPLGLEWIDDTTCVLVFETKGAARTAFRALQKSVAEEPSLDDGSITAKPIPVNVWPAEDRINATLGQGEGLKGILRMRWARAEDVKKKGARDQSEFYRKYGQNAGKGLEEGPRSMKRRRGDPEQEAQEALERAELDAELDRFLAEDEDKPPPPPPPSKMRSDYIGKSKKTLLERTEGGLASRLIAPLPRRARTRRDGDHRPWDKGKEEEGYEEKFEPRSRREPSGKDARRERRQPRPKVTEEDLDAELDAFLNEKL
ncbi:hypothetical protein BD413DRAFT_492814 [Trametes elegans]|nr:hypothetical protein BD413DRAFT_492814 [Trametes elegans]